MYDISYTQKVLKVRIQNIYKYTCVYIHIYIYIHHIYYIYKYVYMYKYISTSTFHLNIIVYFK